jgi:hypothetical protein
MAISDDDLAKTYVFEGKEVKLTGRVAKKTRRSGKEVELWEVASLTVAKNSPSVTQWNKWVNPLDLLHIEGDNKLALEEAQRKSAAEQAAFAARLAAQELNKNNNDTNSGRYSPVFFAVNKHYENVYGLFYCVRLYNDNESFLKIGITKNEIRTRFGSATGRGNYLFEVVFTLRNYIVLLYQLEQGLLRLFNSWKYKPISEFGGDTECLRYECLPLITEACNQWEREYPCE